MNNKDAHMANYKIKSPCRTQFEMQLNCLDNLLPADHIARDIWEFISSMDFSPCYALIKTYHGCDGRPAISPKVLLTLWIYSILNGNLSARKLEELCKNHNAYKWILGGIPINRTTLSEFRTLNPLLFEELLTNSLAVMLKAGLINDTDFAQDGTRVKANAGFNSYHREETLDKTKEKLKEYIAKLNTEDSYDEREHTKLKRIAKDRLERVEEAIKILEKERELKKKNREKHKEDPLTTEELKEMRASTTDPTARKMKMGDGGFRLAYNVQLATGIDSRVIFGVEVGTTIDPGTSPKVMAMVHSRLKKLNMDSPKNWIADCAYSGKSDIEDVAGMFPDCRYYAPAKTRKGIDPKKHLRTDSEAIKRWRNLIGQEEINELYKKRCSTAEFSNAQIKQRGFREFLVRGLDKVKSSTLLNVIAQNIARYFDLRRKQVNI